MVAAASCLYGARRPRQGDERRERRAAGAVRRAGQAAPGRGTDRRLRVEGLTIRHGFPGMTRKQRRLTLIGSGLAVLAVAAILVLTALKDSIVFFNSPTDVLEKQIAAGQRIRLGGLVKPGTL